MKYEDDSKSADKAREAGNTAFKEKNWDLALKYYNEAQKLAKCDEEKLLCYKNRAAVFLKQEKYEDAISDASAALDISPNDPKALFRRCQALERLDRFEEAYRDARHVLLVNPNNKDIQPVLSRLYQKVQEYAKQNSQMSVKIRDAFNFAFNPTEDESKRETAINNILVLARESNGPRALLQAKVIDKIFNAMKVEKCRDIRITMFCILNELCRNDASRTTEIITKLGIPWFFDRLDSNDEGEVGACQNCLQTIITSLSEVEKDTNEDREICEEHKKLLDTILTCLLYATNSRSITGLARDAVLRLLIRNVHSKVISWAHRFMEIKGIQRLLEVAAELSEYRDESSMSITDSTRNLVGACLARIYENMYYEKARQDYLTNVDDFLKSVLLTPDIQSKVKAVVAITVLLTGPLDVGNYVTGKDGIMEMILAMANSEEVVQQKVASECIIAAITKQDKAQFVVAKGIDILKHLFESKNESVRIRALVGLCKAASAGGTDASVRLFADGSTKKMAEACKKFLIKSTDKDTRRWAAEGFAFLSFDAEIKEMLIENEAAIKALIEVAKSNVETSTIYAIVNIFVNLCNAYEKKEILPEMIELAKFAKRHIPEEYELDDEDFVKKRTIILGKLGLTTALVALSKVEGDNCKELIARVFNALCNQPELRGLVVQQGGIKTLVKLASEGTENGKRHASQALARIGITMDPRVAFPGERCMEVVRPLIALLHPDCSALMNFEAMMALCNLASLNEEVRERIIVEKGISKIESYLYEDHVYLCRAATQCITNLAMSPKLVSQYEGENDKFKFMFLLCADDDVETAKAAGGAVAILTGASRKCCERIFKIKDWLDIFRQMLVHPNHEIQLRAVAIVQNVIESGEENAQELLDSQVMEILMALSLKRDDGDEKIREKAEKCLKIAEEMKVIKKKPDEE